MKLAVRLAVKMSRTGQAQPVRHIPNRTCVACREVRPKRELIRLVYTVDDTVEVDPSGKKAGRGVYLCPSADCWQMGLKKDKLERALRGRMSVENRQNLLAFGKTLNPR